MPAVSFKQSTQLAEINTSLSAGGGIVPMAHQIGQCHQTIPKMNIDSGNILMAVGKVIRGKIPKPDDAQAYQMVRQTLRRLFGNADDGDTGMVYVAKILQLRNVLNGKVGQAAVRRFPSVRSKAPISWKPQRRGPPVGNGFTQIAAPMRMAGS